MNVQKNDLFRPSNASASRNIAESEGIKKLFDALYSNPITSTRTGAIFNAHSYPTKVNPEAIIPFIMAHTQPGDCIFDGFAGSGTTGLAVSLCNNPDIETKQRVEEMLGSAKWGQRNSILYDVSVLANTISNTLLAPPNPTRFIDAAKEILTSLERDWGWLYEATNGDSSGNIRYTIWTDHLVCPSCGTSTTFWGSAVTQNPPAIASKTHCSACNTVFGTSKAGRLQEDYWDELLLGVRMRRKRTPVFVYGRTGKSFWKRPISKADIELIERINDIPIPEEVPIVPMMDTKDNGRWGELYRSGYHSGVTHLHHFYTRRNLIALGNAWAATYDYQDEIRQALQFWISSYNSTHSTIMTRIVCKKNSKDFVVTSAEPAALYIGSLPVEKNVFAGLRTKLGPISRAFQTMYSHPSNFSINCSSSLQTNLDDSSVDYIFTDPPFGDNIQYSEVNFINEAWFGRTTNASEEAIVSLFHGKSIDEYHDLLSAAFKEAFRILKPGHYMTVVFHSTRPKIWDALRVSWEKAGFQVVRTTVLNKTQTSFKQTTTNGAVKGDPIILLIKPFDHESFSQNCKFDCDQMLPNDPWDVITKRLTSLGESDDEISERKRQNLYSYLIRHYLEQGQSVPVDASSFFRELNQRFDCYGGIYFTR